MSHHFAAVFSQLRHDKNISQRKAADDLGVSQALLSHYENGIREPRLDFVVKACEYYDVSSDYILGRTSVRENPMTPGAGVLSIDKKQDGDKLSIEGSESIRNLQSAIVVLYNIAVDLRGRSAANEIVKFLGIAAYKVFRYIGIDENDLLGEWITVPECSVNSRCDAAMRLIEADLLEKLSPDNENKMTTDKLKCDFPAVCDMMKKLVEKIDLEIREMNFTLSESPSK